jgi:hypothetical protein
MYVDLKQRLFRYTAVTDWYLQQKQCVFTARYELNLNKILVMRELRFIHRCVNEVCVLLGCYIGFPIIANNLKKAG